MARSRALGLLALVAALALFSTCARAELEGLEEEEPVLAAPAASLVDAAVGQQQPPSSAGEAATNLGGGGSGGQEGAAPAAASAKPSKPLRPAGGSAPAAGAAKRRNSHYLEYAALALFSMYVLSAYFGTRSNAKLAEAWAAAYGAPGTLLDKNFSLIGDGEEGGQAGNLLMKENSNLYKFYASGRRHCQGMLASLTLRARQDMLATLFNLILPMEDLVDIEVYMHEANMPPMVLAIGTPRQIKSLQSSREDVKRYTKLIKVGNELAGRWSNDKLHVVAEHSSLFYDLLADHRAQQVFTAAGYADQLRYFRYMLFTSENSEGSHKRVLRFQFALPHGSDMKAIAALMGLVPLFIDLVGIYKMTPELKKRALDARAKSDAVTAEETRKARLEALQQKKIEKMQEEKEKLHRLPPEARRKAEEKLMRQQAKKAQKVKMIKS